MHCADIVVHTYYNSVVHSVLDPCTACMFLLLSKRLHRASRARPGCLCRRRRIIAPRERAPPLGGARWAKRGYALSKPQLRFCCYCCFSTSLSCSQSALLLTSLTCACSATHQNTVDKPEPEIQTFFYYCNVIFFVM